MRPMTRHTRRVAQVVAVMATSAIALTVVANAKEVATSDDAANVATAQTHIAQTVAAETAGTPGAPGIGDSYYPNYGNGGYDVDNYDVNVDFDDVTGNLTGRTVITAKALQDLSSLNVDFLLTVEKVLVNGKPAAHRTELQHEVVITPDAALAKDAPFTVEVFYSGKPAEVTFDGWTPKWRTLDNGITILGEPESAWWWYPSNDHPLDKATFKVSATSDAKFTPMSNGKLLATKEYKGRKTWTWSNNEPTATYLQFLSIGDFEIERGFASSGQNYVHAFAKSGVDPEIRARAVADLRRTAEVTSWAESVFGPYPFRNIGSVLPAGAFGFALETQTRPVYSPRFWSKGGNMGVVVHEMAHQWWGDSVSVKDWRNIWLNEGFATWSQWKWLEDKENSPSNESFKKAYQARLSTPAFWEVKIGDPGADKVFNGAVYTRGAMTVQALRNKIGDDNHKKLLQTWQAKRLDGHGEISEFIALAEEISGQDLKGFFNVWLYTAERPAPTVENGIPSADFGDAPAPAVARVDVDEDADVIPHR